MIKLPTAARPMDNHRDAEDKGLEQRSPEQRLLAIVLIIGGLLGIPIGFYFLSLQSDSDPGTVPHQTAFTLGIPFLAGSLVILLLTISWLNPRTNPRYLTIATWIGGVLALDLIVWLSFFQ